MAKKVKTSSFFHSRMQQFVANLLFPVGTGDWYKSKGYGAKGANPNDAFSDFMHTQKTDSKAQYYQAFKGLDFKLDMVLSKLSNGDSCALEVLECKPPAINEAEGERAKPGTGKHIVYFPGANTYYQACFRDISTAAHETGATVHAFNFPGTGRSTGRVKEANDLINAGMAVVLSLLKQGVHPDDIILQGDCYGAGIALEVKKQFESQADVKIRVIMNNAFKSFKAAVCDMITESPWLPSRLKSIVKMLLQFTGWHVAPGKKYVGSDPYQCHIQHLDDQTLKTSTLSGKVARYKDEMETGVTTSAKREAKVDTCPEEYKADRDELDAKHLVRVKQSAKKRLGEKFGVDKYGRVNAHFADLCELEMLNGKSVYEGFVNDYITRSDRYIQSNPQVLGTKQVKFLAEADSMEITQDDAENIQFVTQLISEGQIKKFTRSDENAPTAMDSGERVLSR
ncbi:SdbB protein (plasmid) [Legionella adelaidensis]|uniref:SdbB protein n=1 Tax=Legionella adelaidensis TaxID=45056 RepID=A0A0W0R4R2_9GAMM|nr:Dot/Icm T4SS effector alpha/beta hydrolase [Legionella adelaidensis]KTC66051.1 SdbB protein (substrate of the Dot/Icm system) [Legionella adelaidensis]VEH85731.1 SdbB protein [Legionella adelaidensis]